MAMHPGHEDVKVGAKLPGRGSGLEEQVHKHRLAAADRAEQVDPGDRLRLAEQAAIALGRQVGLQAHKGLKRRGLGRIGVQFSRGEAAVKGVAKRAGHRGWE